MLFIGVSLSTLSTAHQCRLTYLTTNILKSLPRPRVPGVSGNHALLPSSYEIHRASHDTPLVVPRANRQHIDTLWKKATPKARHAHEILQNLHSAQLLTKYTCSEIDRYTSTFPRSDEFLSLASGLETSLRDIEAALQRRCAHMCKI
jgi:hypothetical protein